MGVEGVRHPTPPDPWDGFQYSQKPKETTFCKLINFESTHTHTHIHTHYTQTHKHANIGVCSKKGDWCTSDKKCEKSHKRKKLRCFQVLRTLLLSFKDSTFMTHINVNKKCTIRKSGMFLSFKDFTFELIWDVF